ncbi:hypothetical protein [Nostoc sp. MS1]|uniref:hypothetical protein n=1 Tax=Nostoc sp. MS1 TaxID=2764711 RepID=UPI001CC3D9EF|nr:hypothetical protein [Nostoc sp. MS1]BCL40044.1 hypothetical protein NSMS1_64910 [Nostoc sp. MS1]
MSTSSDRNDKDHPNYTFIPPVQYTPQQVRTGNEIVEIINDSNLSDTQKSNAVWLVLNNQNS